MEEAKNQNKKRKKKIGIITCWNKCLSLIIKLKINYILVHLFVTIYKEKLHFLKVFYVCKLLTIVELCKSTFL